MGWTRRANPKWCRKASRQRRPSEAMCSVNYDRQGSVKRNGWEWDWTSSRKRMVRYTNRQRRNAGKLQIMCGLHDHEQWLDEEHELYLDQEAEFEAYIDMPDWWYEPTDDYEYPNKHCNDTDDRFDYYEDDYHYSMY